MKIKLPIRILIWRLPNRRENKLEMVRPILNLKNVKIWLTDTLNAGSKYSFTESPTKQTWANILNDYRNLKKYIFFLLVMRFDDKL